VCIGDAVTEQQAIKEVLLHWNSLRIHGTLGKYVEHCGILIEDVVNHGKSL